VGVRIDRTRRVEELGLRLVAAAMLLAGIVWIGIGLDPRPDANVAADFRPFAMVIGVATIFAGTLTGLRQRADIVVSLIGALAGATFAVATALLTRPETSWAVYSASVVYGALLFGVLLCRGAFRRSPSDPG
jgi:uncharacterized membrane protein (UPF0136 family)